MGYRSALNTRAIFKALIPAIIGFLLIVAGVYLSQPKPEMAGVSSLVDALPFEWLCYLFGLVMLAFSVHTFLSWKA